MIRVLMKSKLQHKPILIIYLDKKNRLTKRQIFVKQIDGNCLTAFCLLRGEQRTFDIRGILATEEFYGKQIAN